jgi:hypothetical protein
MNAARRMAVAVLATVLLAGCRADTPYGYNPGYGCIPYGGYPAQGTYAPYAAPAVYAPATDACCTPTYGGAVPPAVTTPNPAVPTTTVPTTAPPTFNPSSTVPAMPPGQRSAIKTLEPRPAPR